MSTRKPRNARGTVVSRTDGLGKPTPEVSGRPEGGCGPQTGWAGSPRIDVPTCSPVVVPAGAPRWVTVELLEQTLRTWQPYYRRRLTVEDALEMILNVGQLHSFWIGGHSREAVRRLGPRQQS